MFFAYILVVLVKSVIGVIYKCETFFQQIDRNIEKRERAEEKCSSVRNNNNL